MNFYVCVYLQGVFEKVNGLNKARKESANNRALKEYLDRYKNMYKRRLDKNNKRIGRFYDWGDDPAFFAAEYFSKDINKATWGVCRPNVRKELQKRDIVVFFCAQQQKDETTWKYYYVGLGTVGKVVQPREKIWKRQRYAEYKKFFNLIINSKSCHWETINPHKDWAHRLASPYIIFDDSDKMTHFNVANPLHVATYKEDAAPWKGNILEVWELSDELVNKIDELVGERDSGSRLRTTNKYHPHQEMNLATRKRIKLGEKRLKEMRREFLKISRKVAKEKKV